MDYETLDRQERQIHERLEELRVSYEKLARPLIDELVFLRSLRPVTLAMKAEQFAEAMRIEGKEPRS